MEVFLFVPVLLIFVLFILLLRSKSKKNQRKKLSSNSQELSSKDLYREANVLHEQIEKYYDLKDTLGTGATSIVLNAEHLETGVHYAVKIVHRHNLKKADIKLVQNEIRILKALDHPNIIKLKEVFETKHSTCIILELASGGELLERLSRMTNYNEITASRIMKQLMNALQYLHSVGIIHMDIKPRNILFQTQDEDSIIKLSDFGFSNEVANMEGVWDYILGTPEFIAPEVITGGVEFGSPVDIWSAGIILYIMLMGSSPFLADDTDATFELVKKGEYTVNSSLSQQATDLLARMLQKDPSQRITAQESLKQLWITDSELLPSDPLPLVTQRIRRFNARTKLRMGITAVIITNRFLAHIRKRRTLIRELSQKSLARLPRKRSSTTSSLDRGRFGQVPGPVPVPVSAIGQAQQIRKKRNKTHSCGPVRTVTANLHLA